MKYRKLRIAWSAVCGVLCLLLIVLWARSYWIADVIQKGAGSKTMNIFIEPGTFGIGIVNELQPSQWTRFSMPADKYLVVVGVIPPSPSRFWGYSHFQTNALFLPFWFLIVMATMLATVPWLSWRFSLRTLLIATTVIAVVLGIIFAASR